MEGSHTKFPTGLVTSLNGRTIKDPGKSSPGARTSRPTGSFPIHRLDLILILLFDHFALDL